MSQNEVELQNFDQIEVIVSSETYQVYKRRYLMAIFFALATISSSMMFSTCNPIASQLTIIFQISPTLVSLSANAFLLMHPIFTFPQTYIVNKYNSGLSIRIGCILTLAGSLIRVFVHHTDSFYTIILGQIIAGIGRPFIINIQANVAKEWFKPEDKTTVMIAFSFLITCSNIIGVMIPGIVFKGFKASPTDISELQGKELTGQLMDLELIIFCCTLIPPILFYQSYPPTPPGPISSSESLYTYKESLQIMGKNKAFKLLFCCYSLIMGGFHALAVVISFLFNPFGFQSTQIGIIQSAPIFFGFFSSITYSIYIKKYKPYLKKVVILSLIPVLIILGSTYFIIMTQNEIFVLVCFAVIKFNLPFFKALGLFVIPVIPLQLELACQVLYPINQSLSVGFLLAGVHLWSFIFGESLAYVTDDQTKQQSFIGCNLVFLSFLAAFICFLMVKIPRKGEQVNESSSSVKMVEEETSEGPI